MGLEDLKKEILGAVVAGTPTAIAMSEPGSGSDVASLRCRADKVDGGYRLNGQKMWITNAHLSDHILLVARTSDTGDKHQGISMFSVPVSTPGVEIRPIATMGAEVNEVFFSDCEIGPERLVGTEGGGWLQLIAGLNTERVIVGALALGQAAAASRTPSTTSKLVSSSGDRSAPSRPCPIGWPSWPPRSNAPGCWCTTLRNASTRTRAS